MIMYYSFIVILVLAYVAFVVRVQIRLKEVEQGINIFEKNMLDNLDDFENTTLHDLEEFVMSTSNDLDNLEKTIEELIQLIKDYRNQDKSTRLCPECGKLAEYSSYFKQHECIHCDWRGVFYQEDLG